MSDLNKLQKFLDASYRFEYLNALVGGGVAYQVQALREQLGLNQTEFGELVGMKQTVISRMESSEYGAANLKTLVRIASGAGVGLQVRFCDFETLLAADTSPKGLRAEPIADTVARMTPHEPVQSREIVTTQTTPVATQETATWQTTQIQNPSALLVYVTVPSGKSTQMRASRG